MELIGEYHRDKVLCLPKNKRRQMDLPNFREGAKVVNEIFGWVIYCGKERIECSSEEEAKYIFSLWSFNWNDFWIPTDAQYLAEILPRLLVLKEGHDEAIEERVQLYSRKYHNELRRRIYLHSTLRNEEPEEEAVETSEEE